MPNVTVTAAIGSGGPALGGTTTATTDGTGLATFTNLQITGTVGSRTLSFSATGLTGATSGAINLTAGDRDPDRGQSGQQRERDGGDAGGDRRRR